MARTASNSASTHAAPAASFPLLDFFAPQGIVDMAPDSAAALLASLLTDPPPQERPNTSCDFPILDSSDSPATNGSLKLEHWSHFLDLYPDQAFAQQLRSALRHGVKLDYDGPLRHYARLEVSNLPMNQRTNSTCTKRSTQGSSKAGFVRYTIQQATISYARQWV
ncbi:hypothetical protein NDA13_000924 [Ustilago tritici]|nr:hypothetical protein NDA13_000924 [Ustilago tritici]